jgi:hypothetical protein
MDMKALHSLDKLPLNESREVAVTLIDPKKTKNVVRNRLEYDISKAPSPAEVSRIMWQVYLSGNGLSTVGSKWKKTYY